MMEMSVRRGDGLVVQYGQSLGARDGCDLVPLTDGQWTSLQALFGQPNVGVVVNANGTFTALPVPVPTPNPLAPKRTRLFELRAKGWPNLTAAERTEAQQLLFELAP